MLDLRISDLMDHGELLEDHDQLAFNKAKVIADRLAEGEIGGNEGKEGSSC